jgi:phosphoesterase RecJ-like protein
MGPVVPPPTPEQARALELFRRERRFLLAGHVRPDGDCVGAQGALARVLASLGKEVSILNPDPPPAQFDAFVRELPFATYRGGILPEHDVCVLLDVNELERCGDLATPLAAARSKKAIVDHHLFHGVPWWDAAYVDVRASASGLLVWRLARQLGVELDRVAAMAVFTSLVTDTGWFKYSNTDAETLAVAADLLERGVEPQRMYSAIFQQNEPEQPHAVGALLERTEYQAEGRLAIVDQPLAGPGEYALFDSDPVLDLLRAVGAVEVVLFLRELEGGNVKLSARSKSDYDVNALARRFAGGGHRKAAGATIRGTLADVKRRVIDAALEGFRAEGSR